MTDPGPANPQETIPARRPGTGVGPDIPAHTVAAPSDAGPLVTAAAVATPPPPAVPREGDQVAQYKLVKQLGAGGMGMVFQAWDVQLRRHVAIKLLRPESAADTTARSRFVREARAAAGLTHDNVVTIYQVGEHAGTPFLAMQYLLGRSLAQHLARRPGDPLDGPQAVRVAREIAAGLAAAHAKGLVHRDIKPSNVWLDSQTGRVKILDFGLAKLTRSSANVRGLTEPGMVLGTPAYMSPEQARGHPADHRTDLFSLGVVLYELCTGANPFVRPTVMETLTALVDDTPPPVADRNPRVPPPLADLIGRLLAKDPATRPQTAAEVAAELRRIDRGPAAADADPGYEVLDTTASLTADPGFEVVEDAAPEPRPRRRKRTRRPRRLWPGLLLAAGGGAAVAVLVILWGRGKAAAPAATPPPAAAPAAAKPAADTPKEAAAPAPSDRPPPPPPPPGVAAPAARPFPAASKRLTSV